MNEAELAELVARSIANDQGEAYAEHKSEYDSYGSAAVEALRPYLGLADPREIEQNLKARQRVAFRRALAELPEIAPPEVASLLSSVHMQDEFFSEGKRLQRLHGTDAVAPRVEQECGAGAWSLMRQGVLSARNLNRT